MGVQMLGVFLIVFLSLIAVVVTFNTLRLSIYSQKEEIEIMRLVGAKNSFIRGPFWSREGFAGFFAAVISFMLMTIVLFAFNTQLTISLYEFQLSGFLQV
jgi:cell division transport system permease protein